MGVGGTVKVQIVRYALHFRKLGVSRPRCQGFLYVIALLLPKIMEVAIEAFSNNLGRWV